MNRAEVKKQHDMLTRGCGMPKSVLLPHLRREVHLLFHRLRQGGIWEGILHPKPGCLGSSFDRNRIKREVLLLTLGESHHLLHAGIRLSSSLLHTSPSLSREAIFIKQSLATYIKYLCIFGRCIFPTEGSASSWGH